MSLDLPAAVKQCVVLYDRGVVTQHECAHRILDLLATTESEELIQRAFEAVPDYLIPRFRHELHELAEAGYYLRWFATADARTEEQVHVDALARQPQMRRICRTILPLILIRTDRMGK